MTCGIYSLKFNSTDKLYIGQSIDIDKRFLRHLYLLNKGNASNKLQDAYNLYGTPTLNILLEANSSELNDLEKEAINIMDSVNNGFNSRDTPGISGSTSTSDHYNSKFTKRQIMEVLRLLVSDTIYSILDISSITGVTESAIRHISCLESNFWLAEEMPREYDILWLKKLNKESRLSAKAKGIVYPTIYSPEGIGYNIENMCQFAKEHGLGQANLCNVLKGRNKTIKGWHL